MRWWRELFFFSKTEWRGFGGLVLLIGIIIVWNNCDHRTRIEPHWWTQLDSLKLQHKAMRQRSPYNNGVAGHHEHSFKASHPFKANQSLFHFDPNSISKDSLCLLGFSPKQAESIDRYRKSGAKFMDPNDFKRLYVVSPQKFEMLRSYIRINNQFRSLANSSDIKAHRMVEGVFHLDTALQIKMTKRDSLKLIYQLFQCELNKVDSLQLLILPGIGPYTAHKILQYRNKLGGFFSKSQLLEVGIDREWYEQYASKCSVDRSKIQKMRLDSLSWSRLRRHPYVGTYLTRGFQLYIKYHSYPKSWSELIENQIVTTEQAEKLKYYIDIP